jgi:hypothetical protein
LLELVSGSCKFSSKKSVGSNAFGDVKKTGGRTWTIIQEQEKPLPAPGVAQELRWFFM